jgi:hypothetical protein
MFARAHFASSATPSGAGEEGAMSSRRTVGIAEKRFAIEGAPASQGR